MDEDGLAVRDENSTTYVAGIETSTFFGERIYAEAVAHGIGQSWQSGSVSPGVEQLCEICAPWWASLY